MQEADQVPGHGAGAARGGHLGGARNITNTIFVRQANVQLYIFENRVTRASQVRLCGCPRKDTVAIKMFQEVDGRDVKRVLTNTVFIL